MEHNPHPQKQQQQQKTYKSNCITNQNNTDGEQKFTVKLYENILMWNRLFTLSTNIENIENFF